MIEEIRKQLLKCYNDFVQLYGRMSLQKNKKIIMQDSQGFAIISSLEVKIGHNEFAPADILTRSNKAEVAVFSGDDPKEALLWSLSMYGRVAMDWIVKVTDKEESECINELGDMIYLNPISMEWETQERWLSGNVYAKMEDTKRILKELEISS